MRKIPSFLTLVIALSFFLPSLAGAAGQPPPVGGTLPDFSMTSPKESADRDYLGLSRSGSFKVPQIKAQVVIVEIFSMYCPFCQKEAPNVNKLYQAVEANPNLRGKIKIIGIGAGNSAFEVNIFRQKYQIPFPLFADSDFTIHDLLGGVRTPYFIALRINGDGTHRVVYSKLGAFEGVDKFLRLIVSSSGLQ